MSEEERMDKKGNSRSVQKANGADSKKDVSSRNQSQKWGRRRGNGNSGSGNFSYNEGQNRKPTPQKYRNTLDKRPRQRGDYSTGNGGDLEEEDLGAEYGSALQSGSKKGNLNHLLNFKYDTEVPGSGGSGGYRGAGGNYGRGRQLRYRTGGYGNRGSSKVCYNKEQFLQANCQFVVKEAGDYTVQMMDPDQLVNWAAVEQVRVLSMEPPSCPICLQYPAAAKMTRCGHIYCWPCVLHYLALGEKTWRKCPICYEAIHPNDLKSVTCREVRSYKQGDEITLSLMKKEKGSIYAVPANLWQKKTTICHNVQESDEMTRHCKLLTASPEQVLDLLQLEKQQLHMQMVDAEASEEPFIKGAVEQLKARELQLLGIGEDVSPDLSAQGATPDHTTDATRAVPGQEKQDVPVTVHQPQRKMKQYKSAFSDEEEEVEDITTSAEDSTEQQQASDNIAEDSPNDSSPIPMEGARSMEEDVKTGSPETQEPSIEVIPDVMPVEEAAEHLELPDRQRHKSGDNAFYFYQADDGQHIYLHSLNARCLVKEYGSLEHCPQKITATIVDKESVFVTDELRKRLRYLSHLPLTCGFEVVEVALKPPVVSKDTLKLYQEEIERRRRLRQRRAREDKRRSRYIEEQERKKLGINIGTIVQSDFYQPTASSSGGSVRQGSSVSESRSDTSSPLLDTPVGSPAGCVEDSQSGTSPRDDGQTATVSFAQMLKAGSQSTNWPKIKSDSDKTPSQGSSGRKTAGGSDESDNEDKVPVPEFHSSFGSALEAAFVTINSRKEADSNSKASSLGSSPAASGGGQSGKKKKKQLMLFSTSMARGGK